MACGPGADGDGDDARGRGGRRGIGGSERIPVQVEESQESEDVNDNAGAAALPAGLDRGALEP